MGAIPQRSKTPNSSKRSFLAKKGPKHGGREQAPKWNKNQGMSELPMKLQPKKRVLGRSNENIEIGQETSRKSYQKGAARLLVITGAGTCEGGASQSLGKRVHVGQLWQGHGNKGDHHRHVEIVVEHKLAKPNRVELEDCYESGKQKGI